MHYGRESCFWYRYDLKYFRSYWIGPYIINLIETMTGQCLENESLSHYLWKILKIKYKEHMKVELFCNLPLQLLLENHNLQWLNEESQKINFKFFVGEFNFG